MKNNKLVNNRVITAFIISIVSLAAFSSFLSNIDVSNMKKLSTSINGAEKMQDVQIIDTIDEYNKNDNVIPRVEVYEGMTLNELSSKLNRSLNSTIAGKGELIASYSLEKGVDPYLAMGIMLLETGCNWTCSGLVTKCNNVGGQKGSPNCSGGYRSYPTLDDGIKGFIDNLADNYYAIGLTTPEAMNHKYAESNTWAMKVRNYMNSVSAK